ncbi:hypothetical protein BDK51DRAFT_32401 [Blyttiomyces helicus]|uniref:Uncharacterized protein n=1 Tax=Blyttiomyces helicus TaxID=388810 RepID=A0A4P9WEB1_9FUNG|nr:hypothetical protein BDK51DRAFT_32401 [Blyttiomyces helicus]|eukprot:RKO90924.1 hypothetical protein BDK51DRAFT_32401 [Blyttiomyces helicus]
MLAIVSITFPKSLQILALPNAKCQMPKRWTYPLIHPLPFHIPLANLATLATLAPPTPHDYGNGDSEDSSDDNIDEDQHGGGVDNQRPILPLFSQSKASDTCNVQDASPPRALPSRPPCWAMDDHVEEDYDELLHAILLQQIPCKRHPATVRHGEAGQQMAKTQRKTKTHGKLRRRTRIRPETQIPLLTVIEAKVVRITTMKSGGQIVTLSLAADIRDMEKDSLHVVYVAMKRHLTRTGYTKLMNTWLIQNRPSSPKVPRHAPDAEAGQGGVCEAARAIAFGPNDFPHGHCPILGASSRALNICDALKDTHRQAPTVYTFPTEKACVIGFSAALTATAAKFPYPLRRGRTCQALMPFSIVDKQQPDQLGLHTWTHFLEGDLALLAKGLQMHAVWHPRQQPWLHADSGFKSLALTACAMLAWTRELTHKISSTSRIDPPTMPCVADAMDLATDAEIRLSSSSPVRDWPGLRPSDLLLVDMQHRESAKIQQHCMVLVDKLCCLECIGGEAAASDKRFLRNHLRLPAMETATHWKVVLQDNGEVFLELKEAWECWILLCSYLLIIWSHYMSNDDVSALKLLIPTMKELQCKVYNRDKLVHTVNMR